MISPKQESVLIVEDDAGVAILQRKRLERAGFRAVIAATAEQGLSQAREMPFDLIVLDFRLHEGITGLEFHRQLQSLGCELPVIMVTGAGNEATIIEALRAGVRDFVTKSADYLDYLPEAVAKVLHQVRIERELREKDEQLRHAQKLDSLGALAGGVAHEFNNLLQIIGGFCEIAQDGIPTTDPRYEDLSQALKATERAASLAQYLLTFSRRQDLKMSLLDPNAAINELVSMLRRLIGAQIAVHTELMEGAGPLFADATILQQALMNLCINARDAMPEGGELAISTANVTVDELRRAPCEQLAPGSYVLITVSDSGCGMSSEVKARMFEPFFTTKDVGKGTGLGLAMVYGAVQQHGGAIDVESEPGRGTRFCIYLPVNAVTDHVEAGDCPESSDGNGETVLIADDEPQIRELAARMLETAGYRTLTAGDGEEAVRIFRNNSDAIDLVLLDLVLPKLSGQRVYEVMRGLKPDMKVVLCSGYDPQSSCDGMVCVGELEFVRKPFVKRDLLRAVRGALDRAVPATAPG